VTEPDSTPAPTSALPPPAEIVFPEGLVGLPGLVHHGLSVVPDSALYELASRDNPTFGVIAAVADRIKSGFTKKLRERGLINEGEWVLAILAVHGEPPAVTANLAGPLVLDMKNATARQLVLEDPEFRLQEPVVEPT